RIGALIAATVAIVLWTAATASAHPLGNFTINLYSGIHVVPGEIRVDSVVDMAEIPTFQTMPSIDTNGDGVTSEAERSEWAAAEAATVQQQSVSDALLSYPQDLLSSPLHVTSMTASFGPGVSGDSGGDRTTSVTSTGRPLVEGGPFAGLVVRHGFGLVLLGFF